MADVSADSTTHRESEAAPLATGARESARMDALVRAHAATLFRFARSIVHDDGLAEDVVQEALVKAWRRGPIADDGSIPRAWLMTVTRNTAISMLRARRDLPLGPDDLPEQAAPHDTDRTVEGRDAVERLESVLTALDEEARTLILLREVDGLSYDDLAEMLDMPLPTVKTRLFRARRQLKAAMEEWR